MNPSFPTPERRRRSRVRAALVVSAAAAATALVPTAAEAKIVELGTTTDTTAPSCPGKPCLAVSRTTGYQVKIGETRDLFTAPNAGRIVAWTVQLGDPTNKQIKFFNQGFGGEPSAGITVFTQAKRLMATTTGASPVEPLSDYLGETVQFPLERSIPIKKGQRVALTVPTWAPALAVGFDGATSWRASRTEDQCKNTSTQTALTTAGVTRQFRCLYKTARLTYSVTMITDPKPAKQPAKPKTRR
jgi:hypothetical protein